MKSEGGEAAVVLNKITYLSNIEQDALRRSAHWLHRGQGHDQYRPRPLWMVKINTGDEKVKVHLMKIDHGEEGVQEEGLFVPVL